MKMTDTEVAEALAAEPETQEEIQNPTIADRFVGMNQLLVSEKRRTRLSEATLTKTLELAMNYHVWQTQREEAARPQPTYPWDIPQQGEGQDTEDGFVSPEPDEYIGESEEESPSNVVEVEFTPAPEE